MKRLMILVLAICLVVFGASFASAKTLKVALDADPVSLDPHEQLSGGMLQLSHWVFDPLVRWKKEGGFEPAWPLNGKRLTI